MASARKRLPPQDRRRQIIHAAMELFARQGFQGTTTRELAQRVGVNEAILFRHFPRKEDLYWAVLDSKCRSARGRQELRKRLREYPDVREALAAVAEDILRRNLEDPTRSRLFLFSALENHRLSRRLFQTHFARYYEVLADYIRSRIRAGRFRRADPLLAARGFLGMITHYHQVQMLFGGHRKRRYDVKKAGQALADLWLRGMLSGNGDRNHRARRSRPI